MRPKKTDWQDANSLQAIIEVPGVSGGRRQDGRRIALTSNPCSPWSRCWKRIRSGVVSLLVASSLSACSSGTNALLDTARHIIGSGVDVSGARLNPGIRYLRVTVSGRVALLALGYVEAHPLGPIEVWYSAEREVIRLQNGRLVGAVGLTTEWREVNLPEFPKWSELAKRPQGFRWVRTRDLMPGYRFGIKDSLSLRAVTALQRTELLGVDPGSLAWFEESVELDLGSRFFAVFEASLASDLALPPARYAVDLRSSAETVLYGEQCISKDLCLTWQRWPTVNSTGSK